MSWRIGVQEYDVFFNRDERRSRKAALAPRILRQDAVSFLAPLDGDFGGSWLGVNEFGLSLALLNAYADESDLLRRPEDDFTSRGLLLTSLMDARDAKKVLDRLREQSLDGYRSFLLTIFEPGRPPRLARWIERRLSVDSEPGPPMPLVSSAFDSLAARRSRGALFESMRGGRAPDDLELYLAFHESHEPRRGPLSPCMHRPDARTVSFSWVGVESHRVCFRYSPHPPCQGRPAGEPVCLQRRG